MKTKEEITEALETCNMVIERLEKEAKESLERFKIRKRVLQWVLEHIDDDKHIVDWI